MSDITTLKSYLVSLGFTSNMAQFHTAFETPLQLASSLVKKETFSIATDLLKWQAGIFTFLGGIGAAVIGLGEKVSIEDQNFRLFGERMFMDTQHAKGLKIALDALGEPLEAIAFDPELHDRFAQLQIDQRQMMVNLGIDFEKNMKSIRDVRFEFTRLKVEAEYLAMSGVNSLFKALGFGSNDLLANLRNFNDWVIKNIPQLADIFAKHLAPVLKGIVIVFKDLWHMVELGANVFTNLIGVLSNDQSIVGTTNNLDNFAKAIEHVVGWMEELVSAMTRSETMLLHVVNAATLAVAGHLGEAKSELGAALKDLTPGSGFFAGGGIGSTIGGIVGGIGGIEGGPMGIAAGAAGGSFVGGAITSAIGTGLGLLNNPSGTVTAKETNLSNYKSLPTNNVSSLIDAASNDVGIDPRLAHAIAHQESRERQFDNNGKLITSSAGAIGVMQLMPSTAKSLGVDRNDVKENVYGGVELLKQLTAKYHGDVSKIAGAYNLGEPGFDKYLEGKSSLPSETKDYIASIVRQMNTSNGDQSVYRSPLETRQQAMSDNGSSSTQVTIGDILIQQPNATPEEIRQTVISAVQDAKVSSVRRTLPQLSTSYNY